MVASCRGFSREPRRDATSGNVSKGRKAAMNRTLLAPRITCLIGVMLLMVSRSLPAQPAVAQPEPPEMKLAPGSLVVHLGTTDGEKEISLAKDGRFVVHGLLTQEGRVSGLRERLAKAKVAGLVQVQAVKEWKTLPYPDRFVHLVIADLDTLK